MRIRDIKKQLKNRKKTEEVEKSTIHYASYPDRIKAFITDMFMIYMPILYIMAYIILDGKEAFQASSTAQFSAVLIYAVIYAIFVKSSGQTPGKRAYSIKIVDARSFEKLSFTRSILRFVTFLLSATFLLGLLLPLVRKDKKGLHDILLNTAVVVSKE